MYGVDGMEVGRARRARETERGRGIGSEGEEGAVVGGGSREGCGNEGLLGLTWGR